MIVCHAIVDRWHVRKQTLSWKSLHHDEWRVMVDADVIWTKLILGKHKTLYNICTMLDQRRRRWAELYKCYTNVLCLLGITCQIRNMFSMLVRCGSNGSDAKPALTRRPGAHRLVVWSRCVSSNVYLQWPINQCPICYLAEGSCESLLK